MKKSETHAHKMGVWGNGMLNKLKSRTRNRRKRDASKLRRIAGRDAAQEEHIDHET